MWLVSLEALGITNKVTLTDLILEEICEKKQSFSEFNVGFRALLTLYFDKQGTKYGESYIRLSNIHDINHFFSAIPSRSYFLLLLLLVLLLLLFQLWIETVNHANVSIITTYYFFPSLVSTTVYHEISPDTYAYLISKKYEQCTIIYVSHVIYLSCFLQPISILIVSS